MVAEKAADLIRGREPLVSFWSGECGKGKASKTNENLNAPTIMVAEKAADLIRGREPLVPFWSGEQSGGSRLLLVVCSRRFTVKDFVVLFLNGSCFRFSEQLELFVALAL